MKNNIIILLTIIGLIIAGFAFYYQVIYRPKTIINIEKVSEVQLTQSLKIDGLKATYTFNDTIEVKNLWQTTFVLKNSGDKTIYGEGFEEKSIRNNYIPFEITGCDNLLSASITSQNCDAFMIHMPKIVITQWRPKEYIEIKIVTEGVNAPKLTISNREIKDSEITFSVYSPEEINEDKKAIDVLPKNTVNTLRWIVTIVVAFLLLIGIPQMRKQYIGLDGKTARVIFVVFGGLFLLIMLMPFLWMF